jgi:capsule biosynthesis phosphatase
MNDPYNDRRLVMDLDGTLCEQTKGGAEYWDAAPKKDVIDRVNRLYDEGWHITIHTARGMRTCNGDVQKVRELYEQKTLDWLILNGVWFDDLIMGKPVGDKYVDDRSVRPDEFVAGR